MRSWSHHPAMLPCFTGIVLDFPTINKEFVALLLVLCDSCD